MTMDIVFAGTPRFAADHLKLLVDSQHEIKCILTQPDRGSGRGKKVIPSPVKEIGINNGIEVLQPNSLKDGSIVRSLESLKPDILLVVAYGLLIPKKISQIFANMCPHILRPSGCLTRKKLLRAPRRSSKSVACFVGFATFTNCCGTSCKMRK